jgi:hypothetical protein
MKRLEQGGWPSGITRESEFCGIAYISTSLLCQLHARYLISTRLLTTWLADHLLTSNLAQVGFIVQLTGSYLPDMARHVANGRICVRAACEKLTEVCRRVEQQLMLDPIISVQGVVEKG